MVIRQLMMTLVCGLTLLSPQVLLGQLNEFRNLDFEESLVDVNLIGNIQYSPQEIFPGWSFTGNYGTSYLGPHASFLPFRFLTGSFNGGRALAGDFSLVLAAGCGDIDCGSGVEGVSIFQTGLVPNATRSIRLLASGEPESINGAVDAWSIHLGGTKLDLINTGSEEWGANIPQSHAGQVLEFRLGVGADFDPNGFPQFPPAFTFDDIRFSSVPISVTNGLLGDCNQDGVVDFSDIPAFISILIASDYLLEADTNEDGVVDFSDIPAFIEILIAS